MKLLGILTGWREALDTASATRWLWVAALASALPSLALGYAFDDLPHQAMVNGTYDSASRTAAELYCFSLGPGQSMDPALLSWWDDVESSLCFLRPLGSWSLWVDHAWFWHMPVLVHLHSVLWFMGLWLAWRRIFLRYLPAHIANLALLMAAFSGFVSLTTAWIAARHALVGGCLSVWGLYHCLVSRDHGLDGDATTLKFERPSLRECFGWLLIGLALLASEMALGVFGFLVAREWLTGSSNPGVKHALQRGSTSRIVAYAACSLAYVGVHAALGYGAPKYPLYLDPLGDPWPFLRAAPERVLALAGELILGLAADLWVYPSLVPMLAIIAGFAAANLACAVASLAHSALDSVRPLRWLGIGALLGVVPCLGGMQGGRSLTIVGFPLSAVIAAYLVLLPKIREAEGPRPFRGRLHSLSVAILASGALVGNPIAHMVWYGVVVVFDYTAARALDEQSVACAHGSDVYLVDASQWGAPAWFARFKLQDEFNARHFRQLTMIPTAIEAIEVTRTGPSSMNLRAIGGTLLSAMAVPPGSEGRIQAGFARRYEDYGVLVKRVGELGPVEVSFEFARALDSAGLCLFVHDDVRLYQIKPPEVGRSLVVRPQSPLGIDYVSQERGMFTSL